VKSTLGRRKDTVGPKYQAEVGFSLSPTRPWSDWSTCEGIEAVLWEAGGGDGVCNLELGGCWFGSKCAWSAGVRLGDVVMGSDFSDSGDEYSTGCSAEELDEEGNEMEGVPCGRVSRGGALNNVDAVGSEGFPVLCPKYLRLRSSFSGSFSSPGCRGSSFIDCDVKPLTSLPCRFRMWLRSWASESAVRLLFLMIVPTAPNIPLSESMPGCSVFSTITSSSSVSLESFSASVASHTWLAPDSMSVAEWETPSGMVAGA